MSYNDYMYAVDRSDEYLVHYGIKGMRWGVRKALETGNTKKLSRMYKKAAKKLAKLEKRSNGVKYAKRAARLGAGAALAGGVALQGTPGISAGLNKAVDRARKVIPNVINNNMIPDKLLAASGHTSGKVSSALEKLGNKAYDIAQDPDKHIGVNTRLAAKSVDDWGKSRGTVAKALNSNRSITTMANSKNKPGEVARVINNNDVLRAGAAALGAGLAGAAGYNAYRAATAKRNARKATEWRNAMNETFKGTQFDQSRRSHKKRRR